MCNIKSDYYRRQFINTAVLGGLLWLAGSVGIATAYWRVENGAKIIGCYVLLLGLMLMPLLGVSFLIWFIAKKRGKSRIKRS